MKSKRKDKVKDKQKEDHKVNKYLMWKVLTGCQELTKKKRGRKTIGRRKRKRKKKKKRVRINGQLKHSKLTEQKFERLTD